MADSHFFDPKHVAALESKERRTWQNPEEIIEILELEVSYVVADLGCGTGYFTIPISKKVKQVYGIDIQKEMLAPLEQKIKTQKIRNIETLLSKENEIPLKNASINLLLSVNTLHEFQNTEAIIKEMHRVIKADGQAAIIDFKKEEANFGPPVSHRISKEQAKHLFEANGLTALKTHDFQYHYMIVFGKTDS